MKRARYAREQIALLDERNQSCPVSSKIRRNSRSVLLESSLLFFGHYRKEKCCCCAQHLQREGEPAFTSLLAVEVVFFVLHRRQLWETSPKVETTLRQCLI